MIVWRRAALAVGGGLYRAIRPVVFSQSAQTAHEAALRWLARCDYETGAAVLSGVRWLTSADRPVEMGGVRLPMPFILAAGLLKGHGFATEAEAAAAVDAGLNVMPGWRSLPALVGPVEMGSFTRWPRLGNPGRVVWRDVQTRSTQNFVGLKNPGAKAAAAFLAARQAFLPPVYGINVAVSPGVQDPGEERDEALTALHAFLERDLRPAWFTLNISCPNTEDDPTAHQTEARTRGLCSAAVALLKPSGIPLWVKISPGLAEDQYRVVMRVLAESGVSAVIATNTLAQSHPEQSGVMAGIAGGRLHAAALRAARILSETGQRENLPVAVVGCGGIQDAETIGAFSRIGVLAMQYWSALVYRGPLAAALLTAEMMEA